MQTGSFADAQAALSVSSAGIVHDEDASVLGGLEAAAGSERKVLLVALNFPPELVGIGKYVGEMTEDLVRRGFDVRVVTAPPYYPAWSVSQGFKAWRYAREVWRGAGVVRCPLYVPQRPGALKRVLHLLSFALCSAPVILWQALAWKPSVVFVVEPPLACAPLVWLAARLSGAKTWLHVQDFEVDAAFGLGMIRAPRLRRLAVGLESWLMRRFDRVSTISGRMLRRLMAKGVDEERTRLFPNWVDHEHIRPLDRCNPLRAELGIRADQRVLLYSGNMGEKQGLDILIEAARDLADDASTLFLLCGDGAAAERIQHAAADLPNVRFMPLQPLAKLPELLAIADVHLLPQRADAEDLVLPSKLTAMMASGRPVVATASPRSEVGRAVANGGLVVPAGDAPALCAAIRRLLGDNSLRQELGAAARAYSVTHWQRSTVLGRAAEDLRDLAAPQNCNKEGIASSAPMTEQATPRVEYGLSTLQKLSLAGIAAILVAVFHKTMYFIYGFWQLPEYSHGYLVPLVSLLLLWQRRRELQQTPFTGSWAGVGLALTGFALYFIGALASVTTLDAYAMVVTIAGLFLACTGWAAFRIALPALALLLLMIPIPQFFYNNLSSSLQLVSSKIGVEVIRLFGISVFLQGNVIDLGGYKLQVVEACSGLRYLFPLLTLGVIVSALVKLPFWKKLFLVASTVPITILMNSFRIGVIGVLVEYYGIEQAEGFLHDFEGWVVFMLCFALLLGEAWLLVRLGGDRRSLREVLAIDLPAPRPAGTALTPRHTAAAFAAVGALTLVAAVGANLLPNRTEIIPTRTDFTQFPMQVGYWSGRRDRIENQYLDTLKLDDYVLADYAGRGEQAVNFYVAYYQSQRAGHSVHSPASCLPGGGWRMSQFGQHELQGTDSTGRALRVNRAIIEQGKQRELVYYWFKERSRNVTNEYLVKAFLFWDSLFRNRSDGALVRLITPLADGEDVSAGDGRLTKFAAQVTPLLTSYVPD